MWNDKRTLHKGELPFKVRIAIGSYDCVRCDRVHNMECCSNDIEPAKDIYMKIKMKGNQWLKHAAANGVCPFDGRQELAIGYRNCLSVNMTKHPGTRRGPGATPSTPTTYST